MNITFVRDYAELDGLRRRDGAEALVLSSNWVYRAVAGRWQFVRRLGQDAPAMTS